jgi:hypothetical protein
MDSKHKSSLKEGTRIFSSLAIVAFLSTNPCPPNYGIISNVTNATDCDAMNGDWESNNVCCYQP